MWLDEALGSKSTAIPAEEPQGYYQDSMGITDWTEYDAPDGHVY